MVFEDKLTGERSIAIERNRRGLVQLCIAESAYGRCRCGTIVRQQGERSLPGNAVIFFRMVAIHRVDGVPGNPSDWSAGGKQLSEVDLDRVDAGNMVHHHADLPAVVGKTCLPLRVGKRGSECGEGFCAGFETRGEGFRSVAHFESTSEEISQSQ